MSATTTLSTACTFTCLQLISAPQLSHACAMHLHSQHQGTNLPIPIALSQRQQCHTKDDGARLVDEIMESIGHLPFQNDLQLLVHMLVDQGLYLLLVLSFRPHSWLQGRCCTVVSNLRLFSEFSSVSWSVCSVTLLPILPLLSVHTTLGRALQDLSPLCGNSL